MFEEMRRKDRALSYEEAEKILKKCRYGILSTAGDDGYPYGVPLSYVFYDGRIWFHSAKTGHKLRNFRYSDKVSFCVVGDTKVLPEKFSTLYESVIVFGHIRICSDERKLPALMHLIGKYSAEFTEKGSVYARNSLEKVEVYYIEIEHMTGKSRKS